MMLSDRTCCYQLYPNAAGRVIPSPLVSGSSVLHPVKQLLAAFCPGPLWTAEPLQPRHQLLCMLPQASVEPLASLVVAAAPLETRQ